MVDKFVGTWKLINSDGFDDYMKILGVGFATRQVGNYIKPNLTFKMDNQGIINVKSESTFKTIEIQFKLDEPFEETTPDGRETMSIFTLENGKLVQKQTWGGKETTIERQIADDGKLIAKCLMGDVVALRTYEKVV
ncbi:myelin P2 protein [Esox lucius]|uniref:Cytosolic fatty-acid binding proteins domain-containing protein n=1 Tax=Esox lucius TaxID=8010 RepID=A0AAY5L4M8_ESOLU|nr:myelin P2 protein [Esox lucius]